MKHDKPVLIIDLDETLLEVNSFRLWVDYFLFGKFSGISFSKHYMVAVNAAKIMAERKILGKSHYQTKNALQKLWKQTGDNSALLELVARLEKRIRPNMLGLVERIEQKKVDAVMATSAAGVYAVEFGTNIGFSHVLATEIDGEENRSEEKARRVQEFLEKQGWGERKKIFFTDHLEDLPFILACNKLMWFGKEEEIEIIRQSAPELEVIDCINLDSEEIIRTSLQ
jgi:phosphoserine phosphatase